MKNTVIVILLAGLLGACSSSSDNSEQATESSSTWIPAEWIEQRVEASKERLQQSEAGSLVYESIVAHGGLYRWFSNGALSFRFDYQPLGDGGVRRNTFQLVDQWSSRAVHEMVDQRQVRFGWDGENAWSYPDSAELSVNPRFWSTTPFYFVGLPFVLADEGAIHTFMEPDTINGRPYDLVKVSYESGTGDAPDDYYVVYIEQKTKLMGALRYVVSYPGFYPEGEHSSEKIMILKGLQQVDDIKLPTGYKTYWWKGGAGEYITNIDVAEVSFRSDASDADFQMPEGARVQEGY